MEGGRTARYNEINALISRDRDHSEGRGVGVNGLLEPFRKCIRFGTLTRPLDCYVLQSVF